MQLESTSNLKANKIDEIRTREIKDICIDMKIKMRIQLRSRLTTAIESDIRRKEK